MSTKEKINSHNIPDPPTNSGAFHAPPPSPPGIFHFPINNSSPSWFSRPRMSSRQSRSPMMFGSFGVMFPWLLPGIRMLSTHPDP